MFSAYVKVYFEFLPHTIILWQTVSYSNHCFPLLRGETRQAPGGWSKTLEEACGGMKAHLFRLQWEFPHSVCLRSGFSPDPERIHRIKALSAPQAAAIRVVPALGCVYRPINPRLIFARLKYRKTLQSSSVTSLTILVLYTCYWHSCVADCSSC